MQEYYSVSRIRSHQTCSKKHYWSYRVGIEKPRTEKTSLIRGKAFHLGVQLYFTKGKQAAVDGVYNLIQDYIQADYFDVESLQEVTGEVIGMLNYYMPLISERFTPVTLRQLGLADSDELALEVELLHEFEGVQFKGFVDAIMYDNVYEELAVIDWKSRRALSRPDNSIMIDMQVPLYVAVLQAKGVDVIRSYMVECKTSVPSPAVLLQSGKPSTDKRKLAATTWEMWSNTLPPNIDPKLYEQTLKPMMSSVDNFFQVIENVLLPQVVNNYVDIFLDSVAVIENEQAVIPVVNSWVCQFCPFALLCHAELVGANTENLIEEHYQSRSNWGLTEEDEILYTDSID